MSKQLGIPLARQKATVVAALRATRYTFVDYWLERSSGVAMYERVFDRVLTTSLAEMLAIRDPEQTLVLDLMSYGQVLRELDVRRGLAVALTDTRFDGMRGVDKGKIEMVRGNIFAARTWGKIAAYLERQTEQAERKFWMILGRPRGGLVNKLVTPADPLLHFTVLQRLYNMLSSRDGVLLIQVHFSMIGETRSLVEQLNKIDGIRAECYFPPRIFFRHPYTRLGQLRIDKGPEAPEKLNGLIEM
ncbi:hypothetical protein ACFL5U_01615 [Candidatus Margulisiibacteriota bacterium]